MNDVPLIETAAEILSHAALQPPLPLVQQRLVNSLQFRHDELLRLSERPSTLWNRQLTWWHTGRLQSDIEEGHRAFPEILTHEGEGNA